MKSADKFLIGIVGGVILLVAVAFVVVLTLPKPSYQSDNTPEGVAYNYLFSLRQQDYERSYSYLAPTLRGYPRSVADFRMQARNDRYSFQFNDSTTFAVDSTQQSPDGQHASITIRERTFYPGGLFGNNESESLFQMELVRWNNQWKIESSDEYWLNCWEQSSGCLSQ